MFLARMKISNLRTFIRAEACCNVSIVGTRCSRRWPIRLSQRESLCLEGRQKFESSNKPRTPLVARQGCIPTQRSGLRWIRD
jgi:hypothetical protein